MKNIFDNIEIKDNYILFHRHGNGWNSTSGWEISEFIIFVTIVGLLAALFIWFVFSYLKYMRKRKQSIETLDIPVTLPKLDTVRAKVIAKDCELLKFGSKNHSGHKIIYWAEFLTVENRTVKYEITEDIFDSINLHQTGTLATAEGRFFYFGDGEPVE